MTDEEKKQKYDELIKNINREGITCGEYATLAVYDALTEAYNLDCYITPPEQNNPEETAISSQTKLVSLCRLKGGNSYAGSNCGADCKCA